MSTKKTEAKKRPVKHASKQGSKKATKKATKKAAPLVPEQVLNPGRTLSSKTDPDIAPKQATSKYCSSTSWGKGKSGNPAGRPPVRDSLAECFRDYLNGVEKGRIRKNLLIKRLFALTDGATSAVSAARLIIDTVSGVELEERIQRLEEQMAGVAGGGGREGV